MLDVGQPLVSRRCTALTLGTPLLGVVLLFGLVVPASGSSTVSATRDEASQSARGLVTLKWLGVDVSDPGSQRFVLRNDSTLVVRYYGFDPRMPHYSLATKIRGGWRDLKLIWCETGSGLRRLEPGTSIEFSLKLRENLKGPLRIGITVTAGDDLTDKWTVFDIVTRAGLARLSN